MSYRMVVLWHEVGAANAFDRPSHFDLMFEMEGSLWTWAIGKWPPENGERLEAIRLQDHRLAYLDYEGPVSGNRGEVFRRDFGTFQCLSVDVAQIKVRVKTQHWAGVLVLSSSSVTAEN